MNLLVFISIMLIVELYCICFNKGILTYDEKMGVKQYTSLYSNVNNLYERFGNWILEPNSGTIQENVDFSYKKTYNSNGLRDEEPDTATFASKKVIVCIGDSFTEGNGAPQDSTWPALLEQKLNQKYKNLYEVMNAGIAGSDPVYEYNLFKTKLINYHPEILYLSVNISDIIELMSRRGFDRYEQKKVEYYPAPKWEYLYATSRVFRLIANSFFDIDPYLLINPEEKQKRYQKAYLVFNNCLDKFHQLTQQYNCKLVVVYNPHLFEFSNMKSTMNIQFPFEEDLKNDISENINSHQIVFLKDSLIKYSLLDTSKILDYYWKHDYHFNPKGYNAWALYVSGTF